jgi:uncharacterized membrane protein YvlD (DUF360 family)
LLLLAAGFSLAALYHSHAGALFDRDNAFLLWITDKFIEDFEIDGCFTTIMASLIISLFDLVFRWILPGI